MGRTKRTPPRTRSTTGSSSEGINDFTSPPVSLENTNSVFEGEMSDVNDLSFIKSALLDISGKYDILLNKFNELSNEFIAVKNLNVSLVNLVKNLNHVNVNSQPTTNINSFANVVKNNPVVIVKPKNIEQETAVTIKDISSKIDPNCVNVKKVRSANNGGIIIECSSIKESETLRDIAVSTLSDNYDVNVPVGRHPMIRITGFLNTYTDEELLNMIRNHNRSIVGNNSALKVIQRYNFKRSNSYGAKIQVDPVTFSKIMNNKNVRIGFETCNVTEGFGIIRCFKCNDYNHVSAKCTSDTSCPKCGEAHKIADCSSLKTQCINCMKAAESMNIVIDTNHPVWSDQCRVFQEKVAIAKKRTNYDGQ